MTNVVVTGLGVISPVGNSVDAFWQSLVAGRSGVGPIRQFDASAFPVRIAAEVKDFDFHRYISAKEARRFDPFSQFGFAAACDAWTHAGLEGAALNLERVGVVMGCGTGGLHVVQEAGVALQEKGPKAFNPFMVAQLILNIVAGHIAIRFGLQGPNYVVTSACASGGHAISDGVEIIRRGEADVMLVGGCEGSINELGIGSFAAMRALCREFQDEPMRASRPFDAQRAGFVMGEGAGVLVLESEAHARRRGARILATCAGVARTCDAHHIVAPHPEGAQAARCMRLALAQAGVRPEEVDYINAHGTSTALNDAGETKAIRSAFGEHADKVSVSSTKSMTGHLLAGAAAIEAIACVLAIQHGVVPPTINRDTPDPDCDLDVTPHVAKERKVRVAMNNAFGFGGHNSCLVFRAYER
jgi:3-oxoacyl-[acyl-carrier-protein] synthase II